MFDNEGDGLTSAFEFRLQPGLGRRRSWQRWSNFGLTALQPWDRSVISNDEPKKHQQLRGNLIVVHALNLTLNSRWELLGGSLHFLQWCCTRRGPSYRFINGNVLLAADKTVKSDKVFPLFWCNDSAYSITTSCYEISFAETQLNGSFHDFKIAFHEEENSHAHDQLAHTHPNHELSNISWNQVRLVRLFDRVKHIFSYWKKLTLCKWGIFPNFFDRFSQLRLNNFNNHNGLLPAFLELPFIWADIDAKARKSLSHMSNHTWTSWWTMMMVGVTMLRYGKTIEFGNLDTSTCRLKSLLRW